MNKFSIHNDIFPLTIEYLPILLSIFQIESIIFLVVQSFDQMDNIRFEFALKVFG